MTVRHSERTGVVAAEVKDFLDRFRQEHDRCRRRRLDRFTAGFARLRSGIEASDAWTREIERARAPRHNLFRVLGVADSEDATHTRMLADLLDPRGGHGQGFLFLKAFLDVCRRKKGFPEIEGEIESASWFVDQQRATGQGRIDLVLRSRRLGVLLAIENKIYASEGPDQISRYYRWLGTRRRSYGKRAVILLTLEGRAATSAEGCPCVRLSYQDDIRRMLETALTEIVAPRLRESVTQYLETIQSLLPGSRAMEYDDDVIDFLSKPGNFAWAVKVGQHLPRARMKVEVGFWDACLAKVKQRLRASKWAKTWQAIDDPEMTLRNGYGGLWLLPSEIDPEEEDPLAVAFRLVRWNRGKVFLYPGVTLGVDRSWQANPSKEMAQLAEALHGMEYRPKRDTIGWWNWREYRGMDQYVVDISQNTEDLAEEGVEALWEVFTKTAALAEKANAALRRSK